MTPELWSAKKIIDSTLHPETGEPVFLPWRMSCAVLVNFAVTAGMLTPGLKTAGTIFWQVTNQSVNVAVNYSNANKSAPLPRSRVARSYLLAVGASCALAVGLGAAVPRLTALSAPARRVLGRLVPFAAVASASALNVFLTRGGELRAGIDVFAVGDDGGGSADTEDRGGGSLGKSRKAAALAVGETALSRVFNVAPIMVVPPLVLLRLQGTEWLKRRPRMALPINLGLILAMSFAALPFALAAFPQRQKISADRLEREFHGKGGVDGMVMFNRGI
ncbi:putative mitochondrial transport protein fsf1 [Rosellinia necatrix]|uniref:Putative mitochondrial transport protein fsf1 n=1 Tax=Rosellinia necatrix TaxID=77044 RepID=A0A1W2TUF8_ROSNE|nr:putative mitochondrial transport protein fsf1 [Rosellinia necatrix]